MNKHTGRERSNPDQQSPPLPSAAFGTLDSGPDHSVELQLAEAELSPDEMEDSTRMAAFGGVPGQVLCGRIGGVVGCFLAGVAFWRNERWKNLRWCFLMLNLLVVFCMFVLLSLSAL